MTVGVFSEELAAARARDAAVLALMGPHEQMNWNVETYSWQEVELAGRIMGDRADWEEQQGQHEQQQQQQQEQGERQQWLEQQQEQEQGQTGAVRGNLGGNAVAGELEANLCSCLEG